MVGPIPGPQAKLLRSWLCQWHSLEEFRAHIKQIGNQHPIWVAGQGAAKPWREAYAAVECAEALGATACRLVQGDPPDFELRIGPALLKCELVEALDPNRRRGDELRAMAEIYDRGEVHRVEFFSPEQEVDRTLAALPALIQRKIDKGYADAKEWVLVIRLEMSDFGRERAHCLRLIGAAALPAVDEFAEVWVLWKGRVARLSVTPAFTERLSG